MGPGLKAKLARLHGAGPGSRAPEAPIEVPVSTSGDALAEALRAAPRQERIDKLRSAVSALVARDRSSVALAQREHLSAGAARAVPGEVRETPHGPVHVVDTFLEPAHRHGRVPVARALSVDPGVVAQLALDPAFHGLDPRGALYLDTETTGLAGGTGTVPFLVGMAWFEDESLRVAQLFLPELGREAPMLGFLAERIAQASFLVTYNGKSFDWPLLRTRFVMNRVKAPPLPPHLDLLHCVRRAYKARIGSLRLVEMERELLAMLREHDIDGAEIPGIYLAFLRTGREPRLARVVEHNANDLVALAALLGEVAGRYSAARGEDDPLDHLAFARIAHRARDAERALAFARRAASGGGSARCTAEASLLGARIARAAKDPAEEEAFLLGAVDAAQGDAGARAELALALAKLYEHRRRDFERALRVAMDAAGAEDPEAHARRVARLERRIARQAAVVDRAP